MADVTPLRPTVEIDIDVKRELLAWFQQRLEEYTAEQGHLPYSVGFALIGDPTKLQQATAHSWTPTNSRMSQMQVSSTASILFAKRAIQG